VLGVERHLNWPTTWLHRVYSNQGLYFALSPLRTRKGPPAPGLSINELAERGPLTNDADLIADGFNQHKRPSLERRIRPGASKVKVWPAQAGAIEFA